MNGLTPPPSSDAARRRMRSTRRRDTAAELAIRGLLHARGLRFRVDVPVVPGLRRRADVLFKTARVAVYIDGCFWHSCPLHRTAPKANGRWWSEKLSENVRRDRDTDAVLDQLGWVVMRVWEHEDPDEAAGRIAAVVRGRSSSQGR